MGTPVPFCSLPVTVAMEEHATFHQATVVFDESAMSCTAEAPQTTFPGGIFNARATDSGARSMTVIAGATRWAIHDVSHGTFASADMATDLPDATDIRMGIMLSSGTTATHVVEFRFDGTDFTLVAVEEL